MGFAAIAFIVAGYALKQFVDSVKELVRDVAHLHDRITAIEVLLGIVPERRTRNEVQ